MTPRELEEHRVYIVVCRILPEVFVAKQRNKWAGLNTKLQSQVGGAQNTHSHTHTHTHMHFCLPTDAWSSRVSVVSMAPPTNHIGTWDESNWTTQL